MEFQVHASSFQNKFVGYKNKNIFILNFLNTLFVVVITS
jgi:hypothetical protein